MTESLHVLFSRAASVLPEALRARAHVHWVELQPGFTPRLGQENLEYLMMALPQVFATSEFVARACIQHPALLTELMESGDLGRAYAPEELAQRVHKASAQAPDMATLKSVLRRLRRREMVRIAWRDLAGWADLAEVLATLTALADACIDAALARLQTWAAEDYGIPLAPAGTPVYLAVLGMGKLGGGELNFSSDIDLIFTYSDDGDVQRSTSTAIGTTPGMDDSRDGGGRTASGTTVEEIGRRQEQRPRVPVAAELRGRRGELSHHEFFTRIGRRLMGILSEVTEDGFVFRVDMRLRPNGDSGPLALSFDAMEQYYQIHGRAWERYAFIKSRAVTPEAARGHELLARLRPFVYRKYIDFSAVEAIRGLKVAIERELQRKGMEHNIKLGPGGIREIEFIGQAFQLIRGGREPALQVRSIQQVLAALGDNGDLTAQAVAELQAAYVFLRRAENRLQMYADRQTHSLPTEAHEQLALTVAMGFGDWESFYLALRRHMNKVHEHFEQVFVAPQGEAAVAGDTGLAAVWFATLDETTLHQRLVAAGYKHPQATEILLQDLRRGGAYSALSAQGRERLDRLMPLLLGAAGLTADPQTTLMRLVTLLEAILRRSVYLALLVENPLALSQLVKLCAASAWIATWISQHPVLLDELIDPTSLYAPLTKEALQAELRSRLAPLPVDDLEAQMETLREFRHGHVLRVAAADVRGSTSPEGPGVTPEQTGAHLAHIAEVIIEQALALATHSMVAKHGHPSCGQRVAEFAVIAYGKLGSLELGYTSDLDMIFLHEACAGAGMTQGIRPLSNDVFFARLGQRLIHILTTRTPAGILYAVDMRLRPSGQSGPLVTNLPAFMDYQREHAWTWEHQALVRGRAIAGGPAVCQGFEQARRELLCLARVGDKLQNDVVAMRTRMRAAQPPHDPTRFDLKHDPGGMIDIEFMVQYWVLWRAHQHPDLTRQRGTIPILEALASAGLLDAGTAQILVDAYRRYLSLEHRFKLMERQALVAPDELGDYPSKVTAIWEQQLSSK